MPPPRRKPGPKSGSTSKLSKSGSDDSESDSSMPPPKVAKSTVRLNRTVSMPSVSTDAVAVAADGGRKKAETKAVAAAAAGAQAKLGNTVTAPAMPGVVLNRCPSACCPNGSSASSTVVPPVVPPVETWSVVVRSKKATHTPKEVVAKVVEEVGPTLGVRVHDLKPIRGGGAVIRTPSLAERKKIVENKKFDEVGLSVSVNDKLGPRIVVQGVHCQITPDEFMGDLYEQNLRGKFSSEAFRKNVRIVSRP